MKLATTTGDFGRYNLSYIGCIDLVAEAGFRYLDLSLYTVNTDNPLFYGETWENEVLKIRDHVRSKGLTFVQCHSPSTNNLGDAPGSYEDAVLKTVRAVEICDILGIPNMVVHAGFNNKVTDRTEWFEENKKFYLEVIEKTPGSTVNLLTENTTKKNISEAMYLFSGQDMREFADFVNHPRLHCCWDTGHANCEGNQYDDIIAMGDELYAIHFNDNSGRGDEHIIPFMGTMNSDEVITALIDIAFKGPLTFECDSALRPYDYWQGDRKRFTKNTRLSDPPLELQQEIERFMYKTGEYILRAYDIFED